MAITNVIFEFSALKLATPSIIMFFFTSACRKMTICHNPLIINEECVCFNNEFHV